MASEDEVVERIARERAARLVEIFGEDEVNWCLHVVGLQGVLAALKPGDRLPGGLVVAEAERMGTVIGDLIKTSEDAIAAQDALVAELTAENAALRKALEVGVWTESERDGMAGAYRRAEERGRGHYETLFAVGAWLLRHRKAASID